MQLHHGGEEQLAAIFRRFPTIAEQMLSCILRDGKSALRKGQTPLQICLLLVTVAAATWLFGQRAQSLVFFVPSAVRARVERLSTMISSAPPMCGWIASCPFSVERSGNPLSERESARIRTKSPGGGSFSLFATIPIQRSLSVAAGISPSMTKTLRGRGACQWR